MSDTSAPLQGFSDISYPEIGVWQMLEERARSVLALYGYREIRTPVLERVEVFTHSLGDATDIVQKEMYAFEDRGGRKITLRPEGTAGVMRAVAGWGQEIRSPRLFYLGPMFRAERPQAGRKRQFHQLGVESIGRPSPWMDAEVILLQSRIFAAWGLRDAVFQLNTRGGPDDQGRVREELRRLLLPRLPGLCEDCRRRHDQNVLRILDCKNPACQGHLSDLPPLTSFMTDAARAYFDAVQQSLVSVGVPFQVNPRLIRGLDYYQQVVWEVTSPALGAQDALSGGGRYSVSTGKQSIEGVGFGIGLERALMALRLDEAGREACNPAVDVFLVAQNDEAFQANRALAETLRAQGFRCVMEMEPRPMKAQMKAADRWRARRVLIRGGSELAAGTVTLRDMASGDQREIPLTGLAEHLREAFA